ncbi:hypothetical protein G6F56_000775 [Rhizopus delemar]|nr:hypothetical protein G6F56_000775 [Rhizopus delemar]
MFKSTLFSLLVIAVSGIVCDPVNVKRLRCDGDSYKCTADLDFGDGRWVAQWDANVFHNNFKQDEEHISWFHQSQ